MLTQQLMLLNSLLIEVFLHARRRTNSILRPVLDLLYLERTQHVPTVDVWLNGRMIVKQLSMLK